MLWLVDLAESAHVSLQLQPAVYAPITFEEISIMIKLQ